jgi:hypothetical protein
MSTDDKIHAAVDDCLQQLARSGGTLTSADLQAILDKLRNAVPMSAEEAVEELRRRRADGNDNGT